MWSSRVLRLVIVAAAMLAAGPGAAQAQFVLCAPLDGALEARCNEAGALPDDVLYDEQGNLTTDPFFVGPKVLLPTLMKAPRGVRGPINEYPAGGIGPLSLPAGNLSSSMADGDITNYPKVAGFCDLIDPETDVLYDPDESRYYYYAIVGADQCSKKRNMKCEITLIRGDREAETGTFLGTGRDNGYQDKCLASFSHGPYQKRKEHWSSAYIQVESSCSNCYWGAGPGPSGWNCSGQKTRYLVCTKKANGIT